MFGCLGRFRINGDGAQTSARARASDAERKRMAQSVRPMYQLGTFLRAGHPTMLLIFTQMPVMGSGAPRQTHPPPLHQDPHPDHRQLQRARLLAAASSRLPLRPQHL